MRPSNKYYSSPENMGSTPYGSYGVNVGSVGLEGRCMTGFIGSREKCFICGSNLKHESKRRGCFCKNHPQVSATSFYVKFGREIYRRFKFYEEASRFLTGIRFKIDEGSFDIRDYKTDNPLSFRRLAEHWIAYKKLEGDVNAKTIQGFRNFMGRAIDKWQDRNIKTITDGEIDDLIYDPNWVNRYGNPVCNKTRHGLKSCLHSFWTWLAKREKRNGRSMISVPDFPEVKYKLGWRTITTIENLEKILDEVKNISWHINPKIWFGIKLLSTNINVRPNEMRMIKEKDINLESGIILIREPKEGTRNEGKYLILDEDDIEMIESLPVGMPELYFFRHAEGISGVAAGTQFGPKYFKKYWDKACKNLNIDGVGLYGGTKHTVATALGQMLSPEEIKRGGTGSATNKAFDRYYQPQNREKIKVQTAIKELKKKARTNGEVIPLERTRRRR